jgi:hypothetical protein
VDGDSAICSHQQVLSPGGDVVHDLARKVDGRESRHTKVGADEFFASQGNVKAAGSDEHCVALRHGSILRALT